MMSPLLDSDHPSYLALDRHSLGQKQDHVAQHLAGCEACRKHVESLSVAAPEPMLRAVETKLAATRQRRARAWWAASSVLAAAACLILLLGRLGPQSMDERAPYIGAKGQLSVWIYVKRGAVTQLWDGKQPVFPGDRLRMKVDPSTFDRVEVYSVRAPEAPELLHAGSVAPGKSVSLPEAWEVDSEPGAEHLVVVFSKGRVTPVWDEWLRGQVEAGVALLQFVLPKSGAAPPDASGSP
jgi:hypothetical protein